MDREKLNIGIIGYGFMGRVHSNAYRQVTRFFDVPYEPVLKVAAARSSERYYVTPAHRVRRLRSSRSRAHLSVAELCRPATHSYL